MLRSSNVEKSTFRSGRDIILPQAERRGWSGSLIHTHQLAVWLGNLYSTVALIPRHNLYIVFHHILNKICGSVVGSAVTLLQGSFVYLVLAAELLRIGKLAIMKLRSSGEVWQSL